MRPLVTLICLSALVIGLTVSRTRQTPVELGLQGQLDRGGVVYLPSGTLTIHKPLRVGSNTTLRGVNSTLFLASEANCPVLVIQGTNITVAGVTVNGNKPSQSMEFSSRDEGVDGILVENSANVHLWIIRCLNCRSGGVVFTGVSHSEIIGLESSRNQWDGLACYETRGCIFRDLQLFDNDAAGLSVDNNFNTNILSRLELTHNRWAIFMRRSSGNQFEDVHIIGGGASAIFVEDCHMNAFGNLTVSSQ